MGKWNTHGMAGTVDDQMDAVDILALFPEELEALAKHADDKRWIATQMRRHTSQQDKRKWTLIAQFWTHRMRKFKELSALQEYELTEDDRWTLPPTPDSRIR